MAQGIRIRTAVACAAVGFAATAAAESSEYQAMKQLHGAPESGVELGYGWDNIREKPINVRCVEFAPVLATGQHATVHLNEVSDQSEIMDRLGVSASAAVNSTFGSVSGQASFAKSSNVSSKNTTLLLRAVVKNSALFAGPKSGGLRRQEGASRCEWGCDATRRPGLHSNRNSRDRRGGFTV